MLLPAQVNYVRMKIGMIEIGLTRDYTCSGSKEEGLWSRSNRGRFIDLGYASPM